MVNSIPPVSGDSASEKPSGNGPSMQQWMNAWNSHFPTPMTQAQTKEFMQNLERFISSQIQLEQQEAQKAAEKLKEAEEGKQT